MSTSICIRCGHHSTESRPVTNGYHQSCQSRVSIDSDLESVRDLITAVRAGHLTDEELSKLALLCIRLEAVTQVQKARRASVSKPHPVINSGQARRIASEWHSGQWSPLYLFSSCGVITPEVREAIKDEIKANQGTEGAHELQALENFLNLLPDRDTQADNGWIAISHWDDTRASLEESYYD